MNLSVYQNDIIDKVVNSKSNVMIQSYAGCGKTSTLVEIMRHLDKNDSKFYCAFNKDIIFDISKKTKDIENIKISTIHSLGLSIILTNNCYKVKLDEFKYSNELHNNILSYSECFESLGRSEQQKYLSNVKKLSVFCRNNLCDGIKGITNIAKTFGIIPIGDELEAVKKLLKWGKNNVETIDYTDMVWLPNVLPYSFPHYDYIFVDEAQDLSVAQQQIVLKCRNMKTRYIFCGDKFQSIYAFSGADSKSFDNLSNTPNTVTMTLPICYRCDDAIVDFASQIVFGIERNGFENKGHIDFNGTIENIKDGDMVLCRNNAPLIQLYINLLAIGKKCSIMGKEWSDDLIDIINSTSSDNIGSNLMSKGIVSEMYKQLFDTVDYICNTEKCDVSSALNSRSCRNIIDTINTIIILSKDISTKEELIKKITEIFDTESNTDGISLSTIHKAKGLERDNVHILCWSIFDDNIKRMTQDWEKTQELNLKYVAITRAKHELSIINDEEYMKYSSSISVNDYNAIKKRLEFIESNKPIKPISEVLKANSKQPINIIDITKSNNSVNVASILNKFKKRR